MPLVRSGKCPKALSLVVVVALACVIPTRVAHSQDEPMPLARLSAPVVLDGNVDDLAWEEVPPLDLTVYTPTFGGTPTERTEIRVAYDDSYLYVAGKMFDSDPEGVAVKTLYRDRYSGDDVFGIVLDSYNDHETAVWFTTNPAGVQADRTVANDGEFTLGMPMNADWNTYWDVATVRNGDGWFAEMRIPFSSLGFQDRDGHVEMGMSVYRLIARKNERHIFPATPPDWGFLSFAKPSKTQRVTLDGVHSRSPAYVTPYLVGGLSREATLDSVRSVYRFDSDATREVGLDLKYNMTDNLTVDLTANTDFAQVEADDQQVNLTRFSLFFPEKRQFFQERAAVFEFNTGGMSRLFHSRRIGLHEGNPIRIIGGTRLVGRIGGTDIGALNMQTARTDDVPTENFGVLRIRHRVLNQNSTVGGIATTRLGEGGGYNVALGLDGVIRLVGDEYVILKWAETFDDSDSTGLGPLDRGRILARWERRRQTGFSYSADYIRSGEAYSPKMGFRMRDDFTYLGNHLQYQWLLGESSPFHTVSLGTNAYTYLRNSDKQAETTFIEPSLNIEFKNNARLTVSLRNNYESVRDTFSLSDDTDVPTGDYWFHEGFVHFEASRAATFRPTFTLSGGSFYDGWNAALQAAPAWNVSSHFEFSGEYQLNLVRFLDRGQSLNSHLVRLRVDAAADVHLSLSAFLQYNGTADVASVNARLRYRFREGNDLWLVYDEGFNTERGALGDPRMPLSQNRALLIKYTYTFTG